MHMTTVLTILSNCKIEMHVLRVRYCPERQGQDHVTTSVKCTMNRSWIRSMEEVVAIFLDFKGERCSN